MNAGILPAPPSEETIFGLDGRDVGITVEEDEDDGNKNREGLHVKGGGGVGGVRTVGGNDSDLRRKASHNKKQKREKSFKSFGDGSMDKIKTAGETKMITKMDGLNEPWIIQFRDIVQSWSDR